MNHASNSLNRLDLLNQHVSNNQTAAPAKVIRVPKGNFTTCWDYLHMDQYLSERAIKMRNQVQDLMNVARPQLVPYIEKKEFPQFIIEGLKPIGVTGLYVKGYGSPELSMMEAGAMLYECGKLDAGIGLFMFLQNSAGIAVIDHCANEEQKKRILPDCIALKKFTCFGLTEPENGSDATNLNTVARKVEGGYILNGMKKWPGNSLIADYSIIWAKNLDDKNKIQGFIVEKGSKGYTVKGLEGKAAVRLITNCEMELKDVFVPDHNRMDKADDFNTGLNATLMASRLIITWIFAGQMAGAYEAAYKYAMDRVQFGKPIAGFQLTQERLVRMLGEIETSVLYLTRLSQLFEQGKATMGQIAMAKAHISRIGRDVTRTAREIQGANGLLWDNIALKQMMDMEGSYTGEGTYDVNILVTGRELTGLAAFK